MTSKEFIKEQIKQIEIILKDNEKVFSKGMKSLYEDDLKHNNQVLKDLEKYEKIKKMLYNAYIYNEEEYIVFIEVLNNGD